MSVFRVYFDRIEDPSRSCLTIEALVDVVDGVVVDEWLVIRHGPGVGPHRFAPNRAIAWSIHHAHDALVEAGGRAVAPLEEDPQMTLADAPILPGHDPTIRIGSDSAR